MADKRYQVIIVGGGPVGVGLAIELGLRNIKVMLVEQYQQPQPIPKGQNLTQRTLEHFYFWGIEDEIRAARVMPPNYPIRGITTYADLMSDYWYEWFNRGLVRPYFFTDNERLPQYATEAVLRRRMTSLPTVESLFGWTATTVEQDATGVHVTIVERGGSGQRALEADYVVGCDGSRSTVRQQVHIELDKSDHDRLMALIVFRSRELHEKLKRFPESSIYRVLHPDLEGYWRFFGRIDVGEGWFFHAPVPANTTHDNFKPQTLLNQAAGFEFQSELDYVGFWDSRVAIAKTYQQRRVFIAGDACHSHPPYGGYGVNTGLEDARNIGWKLAATLHGWGGEALLASYTEERLPVFRSTATDFIEKFIDNAREFFDLYNPERDRAAFERAWSEMSRGQTSVSAFVPHYEGSSLVYGPENGVSGAKGVHQFAARAGHHLAPQLLSSGKDIFEELGAGFTLLVLDVKAQVVRDFEQAAEVLNIPLKIISDKAEEHLRTYEARLVLIRPDQYVAWAADDPPENPTEILMKAAGYGV